MQERFSHEDYDKIVLTDKNLSKVTIESPYSSLVARYAYVGIFMKNTEKFIISWQVYLFVAL